MKLVNINGGLGNQMFQYAFLLSLKQQCPDKLQIPYYRFFLRFSEIEKHEKYTLEAAFDLEKTNVFVVFLARLIKRFCTKVQFDELVYEPLLHNVNCSRTEYYLGFWQSEKYFASVAEQVRSAFTFRQPEKVECISVLQEIRKANSVSIHVRRGDFLQKPAYIDLCEAGYYGSAIAYMDKHVRDAKFFVFSDDIQWCRDTFKGEQFFLVDCNTGEDVHLDMFLMSECKHNIIANSTFSWWAAWLNGNQQKMVLTPDQWFSEGCVEHDMNDILPEQWLRIELSE
jgi:hypothetical protein